MSASERRSAITKLMKGFIPIQSISPVSGGSGEAKRADYLESLLKSWGLRTKRYVYLDKWGKKRVSVVTRHGSSKRAIWVVAHIDTVGVGDKGEWETDPFKPIVKGGKIFGRGTEDDGQGIAAGMLALKELIDSKSKLKYDYGLVLAADEENGSEYGVRKLIREKIFKKGDMLLVPDGGSKDGLEVEIAEKGRLWIKFTVHGKQVHASTPDLGVNAARLSSELSIGLDRMLHKRFGKSNPLFEPGRSTFEITKREANVESVNIIPGKDVFYMDMRIIPDYSPEEVLRAIKSFVKKSGMRVDVDVGGTGKPTSTDVKKSLIVSLLSSSIKKELGGKVRRIGIGGGTIAAFTREIGLDSVVWAKEAGMLHKANEYVLITNIEKEIDVIKRLYL